MTETMVNLTIEGIPVSVPEGTLAVNAAKEAGVYVPVFCYHPKLEPVGMCRMCLVEIGRPQIDRDSGQPVLDENGEPVLQFGPKLETACTTPVGEGWSIRSTSSKALTGQKEIVEYLLTSHPLDCPICDKGGECPLQELTMDFGAGKSRFIYDNKIQLEKSVPLGDLIFLDRERCIQCARCTRFQDEVVGEPVIGFEERGRRLQIVTYSDPGFDSQFSGNTTDICPVGALTTADFRFEARPWELKAAASVCSHCPVGCNTMLNTRRQPNADGQVTVQRVMPRQNNAVNEIWICDKGRFAHHYAGGQDRLMAPLARAEEEEGVEERPELDVVDWETALDSASAGLQAAEGKILGIAGGRASNEDLFHFKQLLDGLGGQAVLYENMGGGDVVKEHGLQPGSNLASLNAEDAILVVATDLHQEAPIWWLRVKQAAERGVTLVVANGRPTGLDRYATHNVRYAAGEAVSAIQGLKRPGLELEEIGQTLAAAKNLIVFYGREDLDYAGSSALAEACAALLGTSSDNARVNHGLIPVWPRSNTQGAWDLGLRPAEAGLASRIEEASVVLVMAADPAGDDVLMAKALESSDKLIVLELATTRTTEIADVVFPAQSFVEREGTLTSGERRVQRYFPAIPPFGETKADWQILAELGACLEQSLEVHSPALVFENLAYENKEYEGLSYRKLSQIERQWPPVGGNDLYFGGTSYPNGQGIGVQLPVAAPNGRIPVGEIEGLDAATDSELRVISVRSLYTPGRTVVSSELLMPRIDATRIVMHPEDAARNSIEAGSMVAFELDGREESLAVSLSDEVEMGTALLVNHPGYVIAEPMNASIKAAGA